MKYTWNVFKQTISKVCGTCLKQRDKSLQEIFLDPKMILKGLNNELTKVEEKGAYTVM